MKKILFIDDDPQNLELYTAPFETGDFDIMTEQTGVNGLVKAMGFQPDVILLDIMMSQMDGMEVLKRLKSDKFTAEIPVIMLSNVSDAYTMREAKKLGAQDYLYKHSNSPQEVVKRVREFLNMPQTA